MSIGSDQVLKLNGVTVNTDPISNVLNALIALRERGGRHLVVTANADHMVLIRRDLQSGKCIKGRQSSP